MSSNGSKRIIRPEEGDTPRTQSDNFPSEDRDVSDAFCSEEAACAAGQAISSHHFAAFPSQQNVDKNAQIMQDLCLDDSKAGRCIQGDAVLSETHPKPIMSMLMLCVQAPSSPSTSPRTHVTSHNSHLMSKTNRQLACDFYTFKAHIPHSLAY